MAEEAPKDVGDSPSDEETRVRPRFWTSFFGSSRDEPESVQSPDIASREAAAPRYRPTESPLFRDIGSPSVDEINETIDETARADDVAAQIPGTLGDVTDVGALADVLPDSDAPYGGSDFEGVQSIGDVLGDRSGLHVSPGAAGIPDASGGELTPPTTVDQGAPASTGAETVADYVDAASGAVVSSSGPPTAVELLNAVAVSQQLGDGVDITPDAAQDIVRAAENDGVSPLEIVALKQGLDVEVTESEVEDAIANAVAGAAVAATTTDEVIPVDETSGTTPGPQHEDPRDTTKPPENDDMPGVDDGPSGPISFQRVGDPGTILSADIDPAVLAAAAAVRGQYTTPTEDGSEPDLQELIDRTTQLEEQAGSFALDTQILYGDGAGSDGSINLDLYPEPPDPASGGVFDEALDDPTDLGMDLDG